MREYDIKRGGGKFFTDLGKMTDSLEDIASGAYISYFNEEAQEKNPNKEAIVHFINYTDFLTKAKEEYQLFMEARKKEEQS